MEKYIKLKDALREVGVTTWAGARLKGLPAADVRPVVLCRDCDMYECHEYDGGFKYVCRLFKRQMQEADFCSYGVKREESKE